MTDLYLYSWYSARELAEKLHQTWKRNALKLYLILRSGSTWRSWKSLLRNSSGSEGREQK